MTCQEVTAGVINMVMCAFGTTIMFICEREPIVYWLGWAGMALAALFVMMTNTKMYRAHARPKRQPQRPHPQFDDEIFCLSLATILGSNIGLGVCGLVLVCLLGKYWSSYFLGIALISQILFWMLLAVLDFAVTFYSSADNQ